MIAFGAELQIPYLYPNVYCPQNRFGQLLLTPSWTYMIHDLEVFQVVVILEYTASIFQLRWFPSFALRIAYCT